MTLPQAFVDNGKDTGKRIDDVNGDSFPDVLHGDNSYNGQQNGIYLNNGIGGWDWGGALLPEYFISGIPGSDTGTRPIDVNGDFFVDFVRGHYDSSNNTTIKKVYINNTNGTGWTLQPGYSLPEFFVTPFDSGARFADLNADGLVDIPLAKNDGYTAEKRAHINNGDGTGWAYNPSFLLPEYFVGTGDFGTRFVDVNGDGIMDLVRGYGDGFNDIKKVWTNQGSGLWLEETAYTLPTHFALADLGTRIVDVNGDGLSDIIRGGRDGAGNDWNKTWINRGDGTGWSEDTAYVLPELFVWMGDIGTRLADINGDGLVDILRGDNTVQVNKVYLHNGVIPDLLTHITSHTSAQTSITYQASAQYRDGSNNLLNPSLPFSIQTVKQITTNDGRGTLSNTAYSYEGGYYYFNTPYDRKYAGFQKVTETDNSGNVTKTFYHQGNTTDSAQGEYSDHISKRGKPYRVEHYNNAGNVFSKTISKWEHVSLGGTRYFVKKTQELNFSYDGDADHRDTAITFTYDDTSGNLTQKKSWGEVTGADSGTFTDTGTDIFVTDIQYASNPTAYIIGLPKQETTTDQGAQKVSETKHYFDLQALGAVTKGNETKTEYWVTGSTYIDTEKIYNSFGLVTQEKDPRDKPTNYTYDTWNIYPVTVTNALNQQTLYQYDYSSGNVTQATDPNTRVFQTLYDGLDRVKEEKQPDKTTPTTLVTKATYSYNDTANPRSVTKTTYLDASLTNDSVTYVDGLDRTIQTRTRAEDANTYSVKDIVYDSLGHIQKESLPYFSTGSAFTTATANNALYTNYTYDALDRVLNAANAVGTTSHAYDQWKETVTDALNKIKDYTSDAYGNLIKVEEHNTAAVYTTNYTYNGLFKLLNITDALGNVRNFTYDGLGRRLTAQDLHAPADATFGTWNYTYDAASNLTTQLDPKGQTVNYTYDDLNRVSTEDYTGATGTETAYTYDTCTEGKGRLCNVNADADTAYTYYATGEVKTEQKTIDTSSYTTTYTYDRQGNTTNIKYPDNSEVQYAYNAGGLTETVQKKESGGSFTNVVTDFDYSPLGQITYQANANNTATTNTYDSQELYRLKRKQTTGPGGGGGGGTPTTVTFYSTAGDGAIYARSSSWTTVHNATTGNTANYTNSLNYVRTGKNSSTSYHIERHFLPFDTSTLPDDATITDMKLKVYVYSKNNGDNDGDDWVTVVQTSQPSATSLTTADYDLAGAITNPVEGIDTTGRKDITNVATSQYLVFTLNTTGQSWVNKTGITKLGLREGHDAKNVAYNGSNSNYNSLQFRTANYTGTTYDPILEVTYTQAAPPSPTNLQDISYTYDAVGNITQITDASGTDAAKTTTYSYDDLHRLLSSSITGAANGDNTGRTYSYSAIGNILTASDQGTYLYENTNYANPHAVTKVGTAVYAYDNNGNLTSDSVWTHSWNYHNKLTQSQKTGSTVTYQYDHSGQRTKLVNGSSTTRYANKLYNSDGTKNVKHLYAGNQLIATMEGASLQYIHTDHLTGSNATTNSTGGMIQLLDYYPYGSMRIDWKSGTYDEQRKFSNHEYDRDTALTYGNARYYNQGIGRWLSQDAAFLAVGAPKLKEITRLELRKYLENPQLANSYSYVANNPLKHVDKSGEFIQVAIGAGAGFFGGLLSTYARDIATNISNGATGFNILQPQSSLKEYGLRAGQGAAVGAIVSTGGLLTPVLGGAVVAGGTSILIDKSLGNEIDYKQAGLDAAVTAGTAGLVKLTPQVPGRLPNFGTQSFFTGKHAQNQLLGEVVAVGVEYDAKLVSELTDGLFQNDTISTAHYNNSGFGSSLTTPVYVSQERKEVRR